MHRDADGAGLIAMDRVIAWRIHHVDIRGELVAAAVLELVHRLHQADVAFLDQIEELQPRLVYFLAMEMTRQGSPRPFPSWPGWPRARRAG